MCGVIFNYDSLSQWRLGGCSKDGFPSGSATVKRSSFGRETFGDPLFHGRVDRRLGDLPLSEKIYVSFAVV